jgi:hypothetical protein
VRQLVPEINAVRMRSSAAFLSLPIHSHMRINFDPASLLNRQTPKAVDRKLSITKSQNVSVHFRMPPT